MPKLDTKLVSQAAYARHRGCSREAVRQAIATGRIRTFGPSRLIDPVLADHEWRQNTRARAGSQPEAELPPEQAATYADWRCRREAADAKTAELHLAELAGELGRKSVWIAAEQQRASFVRESVLSFASRLSALLAHKSEAECFTLLTDEAHSLLLHLSQTSLAKPGEPRV